MTHPLRALALLLLAAAASWPTTGGAQSAGLRPGDRLFITIRDTASTVIIRTDGRAVLPVVGALAVAGLEPAAAEDSVTRTLAGFVRATDVRVTALRRVVVQGAVRRPDVLFVDATVGLAEALGMAGGVSEDGHRGKIDLFRDGQQLGRYDSRTPSTLNVPLQSGDLILVNERSWWARNPSVLVSLVASVVTVVAVLAQ